MAQVAVVAARYVAPYAMSAVIQQPSQPITVTERDKQIKVIGYLTGGVILLLLFIFIIGKLELFSAKKITPYKTVLISKEKTALQSIASQHGYT